MLQIKIITVTHLSELDTTVNEFLATLDDEAVKDIKTDIEKGTATIQYIIKEAWKNRLCCDCQYWDDGGETSVTGICHCTGKRRRFNNSSCKSFKDVRGE